MTYSQVLIADADGNPLADLNIRARRSWLINDIGEATLWLPTNHPKYSPRLYQYGNLVWIASRTLGNWGGVIREPITLYTDQVEIGCLSGEDLLNDRVCLGMPKLNDAGSGSYLRNAVSFANSKQDLRVRPGTIWEGHSVNVVRIGTETVYQFMGRVQQRSPIEWRLTPQLDAGGRMVFNADLSDQLGDVLPGVVLHDGQGANIEEDDRPTVTIQGRIANSILVSSDGSTAEDAFSGWAQDTNSLALYGLREQAFVEAVGTQSGAVVHARSHAGESARQTAVYNVTTTGRAIMPYIRLGNTLSIRLNKYGVTDTVRITGMAYDDFEGGAALTLYNI